MAQVLQGCARTTEAVRRAIQTSKESIIKLAKRYSITENTVRKWKRRDYVHDSKMGPKDPHSTVLSGIEEAACVAFRKHAQLPLEDSLHALQVAIPKLTRSTLYRVWKRNGINKIPEGEVEKESKKPFSNIRLDIFT